MAVKEEGEIVVVTSGRGQAGGSTGSGDQVTNGNQRSGAEARCTQLQHRTIHRPWDLLSYPGHIQPVIVTKQALFLLQLFMQTVEWLTF